MFKELCDLYPELKYLILPFIGLSIFCIGMAILSRRLDQPSSFYEVECWTGKEYSFHSADIVWHTTTSSGLLVMQDVYGTEYVIADSCSFKKARKEK